MGNYSSTLVGRYLRTQEKAPSKREQCLPECPSCGGLECLCRPRFFPGQLLSDQDLTQLADYVVKKNRLHNRYLHGWGVVCGLEVVCSHCESSTVTVQTGYALSPCGNDIVVCETATVDICDLIRKCRPREPECDPSPERPIPPSTIPGGPSTPRDPCGEGDEEWVLSICYEEKQSRGITALRASVESACCSPCACGGSGSCECRGKKSSCGCGGTGKCGCGGNGSTSSSRTKRNPAQCEPTLICEGYSFKVCRRRKLSAEEERESNVGAITQRALCCFRDLQAAIIPPPSTNDQNQLRDWCCRQKEALLDFLASHPITECLIYDTLSSLCPAPPTPIEPQVIIARVAAIFAYLLRHCICSAMLPPCPCPEEDDCVPIAVVTVRKPECRVIKICNFSERKFATTFPNLQYWLSIFPFGRDLRRVLEALCCGPIRSQGLSTGAVQGRSGRLGRVAFKQQASAFASFYSAATRETKLSPEMLILAEMGVLDDKNQPFATQAELETPMEALFMNQVLAPAITEALPFDLRSLDIKFPDPVEDPDELRDKVFEMKAVIDEQKKIIDDLVNRLKKT